MNAAITAVGALRSAFATSMLRYQRSWGLWLLLLIAPVGARFMISDESGRGVVVAVNEQLPVLTSPVLGVWLGIVVTTLLLPAGYIYLRANTNRRQPWQVEEVTAASRTAILLGRFGADAAVLLAALGTLTMAGWLLGWLLVAGPFDPALITYPLWLVAAPPLIGLAALRILFDARPRLRGALGDLGYFILWMASIVAPIATADQPSTLLSNLSDFGGFVRPLVGPEPVRDTQIAIGGVDTRQGRVSLDVMKGVYAPGYIASRWLWVLIAPIVVLLAGLVYAPHRPGKRPAGQGRVARLLAAGPPPPARIDAPPAGHLSLPVAGLALAEFRLIGAGHPFKLFALAAALAGLAGDYRHIGSPLAVLLLAFALSAHAGRCEARGLLRLTQTAPLSPWLRRGAFVLAGTAWMLLLALPAAVVRLSPEPLGLALAAGGVAALAAMALAALTGSSFTPRVVLLIGWYVYLST